MWMEVKAHNGHGGGETLPDYHASAEWQAAIAVGLDMSLVDLNLSKTPWERMQDHDRALALIQSLQAGRAGQES